MQVAAQDDIGRRKVLFVLGSYGPGRCGISDYAANLVAAAKIAGHDARILAVNDVNVATCQTSDDGCAVQIPSQANARRKTQLIEQELEQLRPDIVAIQYAGYALERRRKWLQLGIPWETQKALASAVRGLKTSLMLHELWIGWQPGSRSMAKWLGWAQSRSLRAFISRLQPALIATNTAAYQSLLRCLGVEASLLPVFSNIPVAHEASRRPEGLDAVHFGLLKWGPAMQRVLDDISVHARALDHRPTISLLGRQPASVRELWKEAAARYEARLDLVATGELPAPQISALLAQANVGLCSTPRCLIGKSGAAAAMAVHGLPVIAPYDYEVQIASSAESWVRNSVEEFLARRSESTDYSRRTPELIVQSIVGENAEYKAISE